MLSASRARISWPGLLSLRHRKLGILLLSDADTREGLRGTEELRGTDARGWLADPDRNQVSRALLRQLLPLAPSSKLHGRWPRQTGVETIAMDPRRSSHVFRQALHHAGIPVWDRLKLQGAGRQGDQLWGVTTASRGSFGADLFIAQTSC